MTPQPSDNHWIFDVLGQIAGITSALLAVGVPYFILMHFILAGALNISQGAALIGAFVLGAGLHLFEVFIHEAGHAIAVRATGGQVHMICVQRWAYTPQTRQWGQIQKPSNAEFAGFVEYTPHWGQFDARRSIWVSLGGVLATGGIALALFVCVILLPEASLWRAPFLALAAYFSCDVVMNLTPLRWAAGGRSDGLHIIDALKGDVWTNDKWAKVRLSAAPYSPLLASNEEWEDIKATTRMRTLPDSLFKTLITKEAKRRGDTALMVTLARKSPWS